MIHDVLWDPCKDSCVQVITQKKLRRNAIHIFQLVWGPSARVRIKAGNPASKTGQFISHHHTPVFQNQLHMNQFQLQHTFVRWKFDSALYSDAHSGKIREVVINALVSHRQGETTAGWCWMACCSAVNLSATSMHCKVTIRHWEPPEAELLGTHEINDQDKSRRPKDPAIQVDFPLPTPLTQLVLCQNPDALENIKIAGKWMFIPLNMVL